jgi:septum formation topological specificity factor MinE
LQVKGLEIYRMDLYAVINMYTNIDRDDFSAPTHKYAKLYYPYLTAF